MRCTVASLGPQPSGEHASARARSRMPSEELEARHRTQQGGGGSTPIGGARGAPAAGGRRRGGGGGSEERREGRGVSKGGSKAAHARHQCGGDSEVPGDGGRRCPRRHPRCRAGYRQCGSGGRNDQVEPAPGGRWWGRCHAKTAGQPATAEPEGGMPPPDHGPTAGQGDPWGSARPRALRGCTISETESAPRAQAARGGGPHRRERPIAQPPPP